MISQFVPKLPKRYKGELSSRLQSFETFKNIKETRLDHNYTSGKFIIEYKIMVVI